MKNWSVTAACGGRYPAVDPVFFSDRSRVAVATALAIKIYQLSTKQAITKISTDCTNVRQLVLSRSEQYFLALHKSGAVEKIGVEENFSQRMEVDHQFTVKRLLHEIADNPSVYLALVANSHGMYELGRLDMSNGVFTTLFESKVAHSDYGLAAASNSAKFVAFAHPKSGKVELLDVKSEICQQLAGANRSNAVSLAVSDSGLVAIGNSSGVIDVVYPQQAGTRALKWHLEPVKSLKFSANDEYLLSGGSERVLVFWQLSTNKQQFLPRLDGTITSIAANSANTLYGLTLNDSQLVIISAVDLVSRLHVAGTKAQFVKLPPDHQVARRRRRKRTNLDMWANTDYSTPLSIHPGTRNAYLLSSSCQAQVFSLIRDDQDSTLNLARTLDTGKVRAELEILDPTVLKLCFTSDGKYMVTVDKAQTPRGLLSSEDRVISLKFWAMVDGSWRTITRVASPHDNISNSRSAMSKDALGSDCGDIEIRDIVTTEKSVITAGSDGSLRVWRVSDEGGVEEHTWTLRNIMPAFAAYTRHVSVALSPDHSVLALAHDTSIYLVDPHKLHIVKQLPNIAGAPVRSLLFARFCVVALTRTRLVSFDLVSMVQRWAISLKSPSNGGRLIAADPVLEKVALAVNYWTPQYRVNSRIVLFDPNSSPVPEESYVHPFAVASLTFIPGTNSFCFIDQRGVLSTLAGAAVPQQEVSSKTLQTTLVSLYEARQSEADTLSSSENGLATRSLDMNSISKVLDPNQSLEQLFDRVLSLVT